MNKLFIASLVIFTFLGLRFFNAKPRKQEITLADIADIKIKLPKHKSARRPANSLVEHDISFKKVRPQDRAQVLNNDTQESGELAFNQADQESYSDPRDQFEDERTTKAEQAPLALLPSPPMNSEQNDYSEAELNGFDDADIAPSQAPNKENTNLGMASGYAIGNVSPPTTDAPVATTPSSPATALPPISVTHMKLVDGQLLIYGANLDTVKNIKVNGQSLSANLVKISQGASQIVAMGLSGMGLVMGKIYNVVLSNAHAQSTFPIELFFEEGSITYDKLAPLTPAEDGYILKWDGINERWVSAPDLQGTSSSGTVTGITRGVGLLLEGSVIETSGVINVNVGNGAGQIPRFDLNEYLNLTADNKLRFYNGDDDEFILGTAHSGAFELKKVSAGNEQAILQVVGNNVLINGQGVCLADGTSCASVGSGSISDGSVTSNKIADGAVGSSKLADSSVVTSKIASGAVTSAKLDSFGANLAGQVLKWNGSSWAAGTDENTVVSETDPTVSEFAKIAPGFCDADQTLKYVVSPVPALVCENINIDIAQVDGLSTALTGKEDLITDSTELQLKSIKLMDMPFPGFGVKLQAPTLAGDVTLTLPASPGASGQVLTSNGSGVLSWVTPTDGTITGVTASAPLSATTTAGSTTISLASNTLTNDHINSSADISWSKISKTGSTQIIAGSALSGGGDLSSDRTLNVNVDGSTVTVSSNNLTLATGGITDSHIKSDAAIAWSKIDTTLAVPGDIGAVPSSRTITAGTGLLGGGDLSANRTLSVDVGTGAEQIVQLDATGKLPAIDGSQLTGIVASKWSDVAGGISYANNVGVGGVLALNHQTGAPTATANIGKIYVASDGKLMFINALGVAVDLTSKDVGSSQIADGAVTSAKIADGAIVNADISPTASIDASKLGGGEVSNSEFNFLDGVTSSIQSQINNKFTFPAAGTALQYINGSGSLITLNTGVVPESGSLYFTPARATSSELTGLSTASTTDVTSSDTILSAIGKLQAKSASIKDVEIIAGTGLLGGGDLSADRTLSVNVGTGANQIVQLDASARLPAIDGSLLTGIATSKWSTVAGGISYANNVGVGGVLNMSHQAGAPTAAVGMGKVYVAADGKLMFINAAGVSIDLTSKVPGSGEVANTQIADGAVNTAKLADNSVTSAKIVDATIVNADISATANIAATKLGTGIVDNTEFNYLNGVTSNIQNQITGKYTFPASGTTLQYVNGTGALATLNTSVVPESGNQYFTGARAIASTLTGLSTASNADVVAADSILTAIGKLQAKSSSMWSKSGAVVYYSGGNVGIGTSTTDQKLHVNGRVRSEGLSISPPGSTFGDYPIDIWQANTGSENTYGENILIGLAPWSSGDSVTIMLGNKYNDPGRMLISRNAPGLLSLGSATAPVLNIRNTGNVGIGVISPTEKLEVNGNVKGSAFLYTSDKRLKVNIETIEDATTKVMGLRGVEFDWKESGEHEIGFIAQEVESIEETLVVTSAATGIKAVKYANIVAILVEAFKDIHQEMEENKKLFTVMHEGLEEKVSKLQREVASLKEEQKTLREENQRLKDDIELIKKHLRID